MRGKKTNVIVNLDVRNQSAWEVIAGILRFTARHPEWNVQMRGNHPLNDGFTYDSNWKPDGIITDGFWQTRDGRRALAEPTLRGAIFISTLPPPGFSIPHKTFRTDDRALAVAAAKLFIHRGLRNFAYACTRGSERWSENRKRFFRAALKDAGYRVSVYTAPPGTGRDWNLDRRALAEWIATLPKPCGIWAANDLRALHVLDACREIGVRIPSQVQILGVDDERCICDQSVPTLSSIPPDFESGGYAAAEALNAILTNRKPRETKLKIGIRGVTERLSTYDLTGSSSRINRAMEFIRKHAVEGITVTSVIRAVGGSERLLEKNFREIVGHSICREIQDVRLDKAKDLLVKTDLPIDEIAQRSGFKRGNYLKNLFKRRFGTTMSDYRLKNRT